LALGSWLLALGFWLLAFGEPQKQNLHTGRSKDKKQIRGQLNVIEPGFEAKSPGLNGVSPLKS
jgi:hypothetical protein